MEEIRKTYKKPNPLIYYLYYFLCKLISKFVFNTKILRNEIKGLKGPYVVLANHESQIDCSNLAITTKRRMHLVISNSFYQTIGLKPLLDMISVIPKQQFQTTTADIRAMKRAIEHNVPLGIYPVGLMTENGLSTDPGISIAKFLKFLKTDVYVCYTEGSYLTQPKWSKVRRKGQITIDVHKLIFKEELETISNDELYQLVRNNIDYNSYENQKKNMIPYKHGNNVEGLEYVLYQCPKCKSIKTMISKDISKLSCTCCGYEVDTNNYGLFNGEGLIFDNPADWSIEILENFKKELILNSDYQLNDEVTISMINSRSHKFEEVGTGHISINKENIILKGTINNNAIEYRFFTNAYPMLPFVPGKHLEIQDEQNIYRLKFKDPYNIMIFINILKIVNKSY